MSKRCSTIPSSWASVRASSVFPTPVAPTKSKFAIGLCFTRNPTRARFSVRVTKSIASPCPKIFSEILRSKLRNFSISLADTRCLGIFAIFATISSISDSPITEHTPSVPCFPRDSFAHAPASSIISIALSGRCLPWMYCTESLTAAANASSL